MDKTQPGMESPRWPSGTRTSPAKPGFKQSQDPQTAAEEETPPPRGSSNPWQSSPNPRGKLCLLCHSPVSPCAVKLNEEQQKNTPTLYPKAEEKTLPGSAPAGISPFQPRKAAFLPDVGFHGPFARLLQFPSLHSSRNCGDRLGLEGAGSCFLRRMRRRQEERKGRRRAGREKVRGNNWREIAEKVALGWGEDTGGMEEGSAPATHPHFPAAPEQDQAPLLSFRAEMEQSGLPDHPRSSSELAGSESRISSPERKPEPKLQEMTPKMIQGTWSSHRIPHCFSLAVTTTRSREHKNSTKGFDTLISQILSLFPAVPNSEQFLSPTSLGTPQHLPPCALGCSPLNPQQL